MLKNKAINIRFKFNVLPASIRSGNILIQSIYIFNLNIKFINFILKKIIKMTLKIF